MKARTVVILITVLVAQAATARADDVDPLVYRVQSDGPPGASPAPPPQIEVTRYGLITAAADLTALLLVSRFEKQAVMLGGIGYLVAAPAIHLGYGQGGRAVGSFALRASVPLALGLAWAGHRTDSDDDPYCFENCDDEDAIVFQFIIGAGIGAILTSALDALVIARRERTVEAPSIAPMVTPGPSGGMQLGIRGWF